MIDALIQIWQRELRESRDDLSFNTHLYRGDVTWEPIADGDHRRDNEAVCRRIDRAIYTLDDLKCIREGRVPTEIWF